MKKIIYLLLLLPVSLVINAQKLITTSGGEGAGVLWSIGEIATTSISDSNVSVSQGFLQPGDLPWTAIADIQSDTRMNVYPNPVIDFLHVSSDQAFTWKLYDSLGRLLSYGATGSNEAEIDFGAYAQGYYVLIITKKEGMRSVKVIK